MLVAVNMTDAITSGNDDSLTVVLLQHVLMLYSKGLSTDISSGQQFALEMCLQGTSLPRAEQDLLTGMQSVCSITFMNALSSAKKAKTSADHRSD